MTSHTDWVEDSSLTVLDRSTLEVWAECPTQAKLLEENLIVRASSDMNVGIEGHEVFSDVTREYLHDSEQAHAGIIKDVFDQRMAQTRPDLQPDVISALSRSAWKWAQFICDIHPTNILRYDGGQDDLSGQLSWDMPWLDARVTSEIDLLYSGDSPDVLHEIDYKTGWTKHGEEAVKNSFQFQLHAALLLENYPSVKAINIRVWDTRKGWPTYSMMFPREKLQQYQYRIERAVRMWSQYHKQPIEKIPAWADTEKCRICPVSVHCPLVKATVATPAELVQKLIVVEAAREELRSALIAIRKSTGEDIEAPSGDVFGKDKPKEKESPTYTIYRRK